MPLPTYWSAGAGTVMRPIRARFFSRAGTTPTWRNPRRREAPAGVLTTRPFVWLALRSLGVVGRIGETEEVTRPPSRSFSGKEEHRRDAYYTLDSATFVPQERTAFSQFEYGCHCAVGRSLQMRCQGRYERRTEMLIEWSRLRRRFLSRTLPKTAPKVS